MNFNLTTKYQPADDQPEAIKQLVQGGATYTDSWKTSNLPESRFMKAEDIAQTIWDVYHLSENTVIEKILLRPVLGGI